MSNWGEEALALCQVNQLGRRCHRQKGGKWWWRRFAVRRKQKERQKAGAVDKVWRPGEENAQLEAALGNGGKQHQLHYQSYLWCAPIFKEPPRVVWGQLVLSAQLWKHSNISCKTSLTQGHYSWRHNQILKSLAAALETKRKATNSLPIRAVNSITAPTFIHEWQTGPNHSPAKPEIGKLAIARDWKMLVDIGKQLVFPPEIATTTLRPDLVLWSPQLNLLTS